MKILIVSAFVLFSGTALAEKPCYHDMSDAVYAQYAKDEGYTLLEAQSRADLFENGFRSISRGYEFRVELAEQYATDSESGYFPGTPYLVTLTKNCRLLSIKKVAR